MSSILVLFLQSEINVHNKTKGNFFQLLFYCLSFVPRVSLFASFSFISSTSLL